MVIKNILLQSETMQAKSKQLLEMAKVAVEKAIETGETQALAWLAQEKDALGFVSAPV